MRRPFRLGFCLPIIAVLAAVAVISTAALAGESSCGCVAAKCPKQFHRKQACSECQAETCDECGASGDDCESGHGCGCLHALHGAHDKWGRRRYQEDWYNCNCNGSYKFPVPPLYTYHWPGMFSQELMTDYHSPWRFPPLRPYAPEAPTGGAAASGPLRQTSAEFFFAPDEDEMAATPIAPEEPVSLKMKRYFGN